MNMNLNKSSPSNYGNILAARATSSCGVSMIPQGYWTESSRWHMSDHGPQADVDQDGPGHHLGCLCSLKIVGSTQMTCWAE